jgi:hypothetical protein
MFSASWFKSLANKFATINAKPTMQTLFRMSLGTRVGRAIDVNLSFLPRETASGSS